MDLSRLLRPRSVAVVGATERDDSYAGETLLNLNAAGFPGAVWGVNPGRSEAHGRPCFPSLSDLPEVPDAVVIAIPAAGVADVVEEAGALGCGGAVVYGAGFGEVESGTEHQRRLTEAAGRHSLPVCGPNGNGIVALHGRATLWGDTLRPLAAGPVALVSQSGNVAVNALAARRSGLRLHTVVSCGNSVISTLRTGSRRSPARRGSARSRSTWRRTATARPCARRSPSAPSAEWAWRS